MMERQPCAFCKGKGRVTHSYDGPVSRADNVERLDVTLVCEACSGTGDRHLMELVRAFRLGQTHEHAVIMARLVGGEAPRFPSAEQIRRAVVDDETRQRYEDAMA